METVSHSLFFSSLLQFAKWQNYEVIFLFLSWNRTTIKNIDHQEISGYIWFTFLHYFRGRRDPMLFGFTTTYAISAYRQ